MSYSYQRVLFSSVDRSVTREYNELDLRHESRLSLS